MVKKIKKIIIFGIVFLVLASIASATYWCGDGLCEAEYCPDDCVDFLASYCGDLIEPWECDALCGSELGWIRPFECGDYGYTPTEDCLDCDSCCPDCPDGDCLGTCIDESSRVAGDEYCTSRGYIDEDDCPVGEDCPVCEDMTEVECIDTYGLFASCDDMLTEPECIATYGLYDDCDDCDSCCPECDTCPGYEHCDSCCPEAEAEYQYPWWLLLIGFVVGYFFKEVKFKR